MQMVNYQIYLYPQHEDKRIERIVREIYQKISRIGNLERTKDGTNETRDMSKKPNSCQGDPITSPTIGKTKLNNQTHDLTNSSRGPRGKCKNV